MPQPRDMPADRIGYLGIDLGTSGLKLALVGADGLVVAESEAAYDVTAPQPGWAETDPAAWVRALERAARSIARQLQELTLRGVGVTGQMHGTVLVDPAGRPVRSAVLWPDRRANAELDLWRSMPRTQRARLANPLVPGMTGPVLAWLARNEPERLEAAATVLLPKDYLRSVLTGRGGSDPGDRHGCTDRSDASGTLLWDMVSDDWAEGVGGVVDVDLLPVIRPADCVVGTTGWLVERAGGTSDVPVVVGCADTAATLVALAATTQIGESAPLVVNLGTGAQILRPDAQVLACVDPLSHTYADAGRGSYVMVAVQNAGLALSWVQQLLALSWPDFVDSAAAEDGSGDVSFVPFLTGERGGLAGPSSRAAWLGLTESTTPSQLARAAFEAMAFSVRRAVELSGQPPRGPLLLSGGGGREPLVQQLIADTLAAPVLRVGLRSASAIGAAVLAARGTGRALRIPVEPVHIEPHTSAGLERAYARWCDRLAGGDL